LDAIFLDIEASEKDRLRGDIRDVRLNTRENITKKSELIRKYASIYNGNDPSLNMEEIKKAIDSAHKLINTTNFSVSLQRAEKLAKPEKFRVIVEKRQENVSQEFSWSWSEKTTGATWENEEKMIQWDPFDTITVKIEIDGWLWLSNFVIRTAQDSTPLSLRILGRNIKDWSQDENYEKYSSYIDQSQPFSVRFSIKEFEEEDWELLAKYFDPGGFWKK
jgi:hypothetical protein